MLPGPLVRRDGFTLTLAIAAILFVLIAAGGYIPASWVPAAPDGVIAAIPPVNVLLSLLAIAAILDGWRVIRQRAIAAHRRRMVLATGLFVAFLGLYLYRLIVLGGPSGFEGAEWIYRYVYLPVLALHIGLAIVCIPLVFDALALGLTVSSARLSRTRHPRIGRIAAALWITSFTLGIVVYLLLHVV